MKYLRAQDQIDEPQTGLLPLLDVAQFLGNWLNTNYENPGIVKVTCTTDEGGLRVVFLGNGAAEPAKWGEAAAEVVCAASIRGGTGMSFVASFDLGFKIVEVGANLNQGLLVIAGYHTLRNDKAHSDYFSREFFRRAAED